MASVTVPPEDQVTHAELLMTKLEETKRVLQELAALASDTDRVPAGVSEKLVSAVSAMQEPLDRIYERLAVHIYRKRREAGLP